MWKQGRISLHILTCFRWFLKEFIFQEWAHHYKGMLKIRYIQI